jgi:NAD(P)-dependent dehydrogenase (short-subunit alcohol dehydrogenase family)
VALTTTASTVRGRLDDKVVLITGTGRGQGRAAAQLFCTEGARVVGCDLDAPANAETVSTITASGGHIVGMAPVDLGDSAQARQWVHDAAAVHGRIDVLFNNAAAPRFAAIDDLTDDDWHSTIRNELDLIFYVTQAAWQYVSASSGTIVNTASVQAHIGIPPNGGLAHAAAKGGVVAMTRQLAAEGAPLGIRANSIARERLKPPPTRTSSTPTRLDRRFWLPFSSSGSDKPATSPHSRSTSRPTNPPTSAAPTSSSMAASRQPRAPTRRILWDGPATSSMTRRAGRTCRVPGGR